MRATRWARDMDIQPGHGAGLRELALFAGGGGGILGGHLLGWRTICAVEWDPYAASVLVARQNDGILAPFPIWDNVQNFDGTRWRGRVDVVSGGFPCQDISVAGKGAGIDGERSGMWAHMARIIGEVRPRYAFIENSPMLTSRGLDRVLADLAAIGFDAEWGTLSAADVGAPHKRDRIWILARNMGNTNSAKRTGLSSGKTAKIAILGGDGQYEGVADTKGGGWERGCKPTSGWEGEGEGLCAESARGSGGWRSIGWPLEPDVGRVADELAYRLDLTGANES